MNLTSSTKKWAKKSLHKLLRASQKEIKKNSKERENLFVFLQTINNSFNRQVFQNHISNLLQQGSIWKTIQMAQDFINFKYQMFQYLVNFHPWCKELSCHHNNFFCWQNWVICEGILFPWCYSIGNLFYLKYLVLAC